MANYPALLQEAESAYERAGPDDMGDLIRMLTTYPQFAMLTNREVSAPVPATSFTSNEALWAEFHAHQLPDTSRVRLEHFHLFEWFPLSPGRYHTEQGRQYRSDAQSALRRDETGSYYNPDGKVNMIKGGIGAVKLKSRPFPNHQGMIEQHYLMTASSNGVCHEGVPLLVPRSLYGDVIRRIRGEGAAPILVAGEMKQLPDSARSFFGELHLAHVPNCVLHVENIEELDQSRADVTRYTVAIALAFHGTFQGHQDLFMSYCTFDPANPTSRQDKVAWLQQYVQSYQGQVLTDFDEDSPAFANAPFALRRIMSGALDPLAIEELMHQFGYYYFGHSETAVRQAVTAHNTYYIDTYVGPRGINVQGNVGGSVISGDNNQVS